MPLLTERKNQGFSKAINILLRGSKDKQSEWLKSPIANCQLPIADYVEALPSSRSRRWLTGDSAPTEHHVYSLGSLEEFRAPTERDVVLFVRYKHFAPLEQRQIADCRLVEINPNDKLPNGD